MPGFDECRVRCVPNYIDTNLFSPGSTVDAAVDVLAVGRLHAEKRLRLLLEAISKIPGAGLTLVGDGPERATLEREARRLGVPLTLRGRVSNEALPDLYRRCRVFAITSVREGNPKSLLEAMACGAACVGTSKPGIIDVITNGRTGLLCDDSGASSPQRRAGVQPLDRDRRTLRRRHRRAGLRRAGGRLLAQRE
jgi:glycosyltransferase involved in cell wall biosynthesis